MNTFITIWDGIKSSLYDLITIFYPTRLFDTYTNQYLVKDNEKYNHYAAQFVFQYKFIEMYSIPERFFKIYEISSPTLFIVTFANTEDRHF